MNSGISILLAGVLCAAVTNNNLYGQSVKADLMNKNSLVYFDHETVTNPGGPFPKLTGARRVNPKALRDFLLEYKDFDSVRWYQNDKGSVASFIWDEMETLTYYDRYGNRIMKRKVYKENRLPREVRHLVKSKYYDYEITGVIEIIWPKQSIYVVTMEDKTRYVQVKVEDMEMEVVSRFFKSK